MLNQRDLDGAGTPESGTIHLPGSVRRRLVHRPVGLKSMTPYELRNHSDDIPKFDLPGTGEQKTRTQGANELSPEDEE